MNNPKAATAATGLHTAASRGLGFLTRGSNYNKSSAAATPKEDEEPSSKSQQLRLEEDDAATSATTDDDATNNILNVFKKKNPPPTTNNNERRTIIPEESGSPSSSIPTTTATNTTTAAGASDLLRHCQQRHDRLVALERERRATVGRDIVAHGARYTALRQLVAVQAVHETQAAGRWTLGIALAQTQLAQTLTTLNDQQAAVIERELRDDLYRDTTEVVARVTGQDSLPEKEKIRTTPVGVYPENDNDDDVDSETGILMGSNPGGAPAAAEVEAPSTAMSNNTAKENQPPVFSICFPNPNASSGGEETFAILHKQHVLLSEALSRSTVSDAAMDKMQVIQELCVEHASKLEEVAGGIAAELQAQETEIRKLWDSYKGVAEGVLAVTPKKSEIASLNKSSHNASAAATVGDVWVAELAYQSAVCRQSSNWDNQKATLQSMFEVAKDGERQRRLKLRKHLQVSVLQKHAAAFQRAQQLHTDALEQCMKAEGNTVDDSSEKADGKDKETKKKNKPPIKTVMTVKEHIEHVANVLGSTVVWDNPQEDVVVVDVEKEAKASPAMVSVDDEESGGFDVDGYADCSSDEEDLPLLADAEDLKAQQEKQLKSTIEKESSKTAKPERKKKSKGRRSKSRSRSKRAADSLKKITGLILLDQESLDQSFFMDRVLYSGSLIESPFVLFAGVAILENDRPDLVVLESSLDSSERTQTLKQKITLVIVTKDLVLHLFDIPCERETITETANEIDGVDPRLTAASSQDVFVPGSPPTSALRFLLRRFEIADMLRKQQNVLCSDTDAPASTSKLSFRRSKPVKEKVPLFQFQFQHLRPSLSFPLAQSNVRFYKRGENAVNISPRSDQSLQFFAKLSFGSTNDQQAFVEACQFQDGNVQ